MHAHKISFALCALCLVMACEQALGFAPSSGMADGLDHPLSSVETGIDGVDALDLEFEGLEHVRREATHSRPVPAPEALPQVAQDVETQKAASPSAVPALADDTFAAARKAQAAAAAAASAPQEAKRAEEAAKAAALSRVEEMTPSNQPRHDDETLAPAACALALAQSQSKVDAVEAEVATLTKKVETLAARAADAKVAQARATADHEAAVAPALSAKQVNDAVHVAAEQLATAVKKSGLTAAVSEQVAKAASSASGLVGVKLIAIHDAAKNGADQKVIVSQVNQLLARVQRESERSAGDVENKSAAAAKSVQFSNKAQSELEEQSTLLTATQTELVAARHALSQMQAKCSA